MQAVDPGARSALCGTVPWGYPRRQLAGILALWSPDFPPTPPFARCARGHLSTRDSRRHPSMRKGPRHRLGVYGASWLIDRRFALPRSIGPCTAHSSGPPGCTSCRTCSGCTPPTPRLPPCPLGCPCSCRPGRKRCLCTSLHNPGSARTTGRRRWSQRIGFVGRSRRSDNRRRSHWAPSTGPGCTSRRVCTQSPDPSSGICRCRAGRCGWRRCWASIPPG